MVVGFIGLSIPSSIFAQYYDDYEKKYDYEKYMKNDDSRPIINKIICNNINKNPSDNNNVITNSVSDLTHVDSQSDQRINPMNTDDQEGNFVSICQNNDNLNIINPTLIINNGTTINNNTLSIGNNNPNNQTIDLSQDACLNAITTSQSANVDSGGGNISDSGNNFVTGTQSNDCTVTQTQSNLTQSIQDNSTNTGVISLSSFANGEQSEAQTQHIKLLQDGNGVEINQQGNQPIDVQQIKSSNTNNGLAIQQQRAIDSSKLTAMDKQPDSQDLTAMEKITKLKTQWLNQLP